eukprot:scaffold8069_cov126-Isochrysis_galbana.AAC.15
MACGAMDWNLKVVGLWDEGAFFLLGWRWMRRGLLPWGGEVAPCFVMNTLAHMKEEALGGVSAAEVELSNPPAAAATVADMSSYFGLHCGGEDAFGGAQIAVTSIGSKA